MTHRVGPKGQVVIPKAMRDGLGLRPGSEVTFERHGSVVHVRKVRSAHELRGCLSAAGSATAALEAERAADRHREEQGVR